MRECRFCKSDHSVNLNGYGSCGYWVKCLSCNAEGPCCDTKREALSKWDEMMTVPETSCEFKPGDEVYAVSGDSNTASISKQTIVTVRTTTTREGTSANLSSYHGCGIGFANKDVFPRTKEGLKAALVRIEEIMGENN